MSVLELVLTQTLTQMFQLRVSWWMPGKRNTRKKKIMKKWLLGLCGGAVVLSVELSFQWVACLFLINMYECIYMIKPDSSS